MAFELQAQTRVIEGKEYSVTPLGAVTGRKVLTRLLKIVGPAIDKASIGDLVANLQESDIDYFCDLFAKSTRVTTGTDKNNMPVQPLLSDNGLFDLHFAGNYGAMVLWLKFCLEVNFSSFFQSLGSVLGSVASKPKTA